MTSLIVSDLHETDHPRDTERWNLFPWLAEQAKKYRIGEVLILGDITESKDRHSAILVNKMVNNIVTLSDMVPVYILCGNHDRIDPDHPFFGFLNHTDVNVKFINVPTVYKLSEGKSLFLPCTDAWEEDWRPYGDFSEFDYVFTHQTYEGAVSETGYPMKGLPNYLFKNVRKHAFSGDIHVPQVIGPKLEYVGAPYWVRYGDHFEPRVLMIGTTRDGQHQQQNLHFPTKGKHLIELANADRIEDYDAPEGASVKIRVMVKRSELPEWEATKARLQAHAKSRGWLVHGIEPMAIGEAYNPDASGLVANKGLSPKELYAEFCREKGAPAAVVEWGLELL